MYSDYQDVPNHMFPYFPVKRNPGRMSTLMLGYPVLLPEGVSAWWAKLLTNDDKGTKVHLQKLGTKIIPALTPVLLTYEATTEPLYLSRYEGSDVGAATEWIDGEPIDPSLFDDPDDPSIIFDPDPLNTTEDAL